MKFTIVFARKAEKQLAQLELIPRQSILEKINQLEEGDLRSLDIRKLSKPLEGYRLRDGDYRILFTLEGSLIRIYRIRHRKDVYR